MAAINKLVRFDWAIKRLLRNKADYVVVEGLLTCLLNKKITIKNLLESESNKDTIDDKFNRVDLLAEDENGELIIFEIQNDHQLDYFQRMAYGTSKSISEYLKEGDAHKEIKKLYSVNIVYFSLGQGNDYVYVGKTDFHSLHHPDEILDLTPRQKEVFACETPSDIFPEYYLLRVDKFDDVATTPLDEWINFLKNGDIPETATAPGLPEARERLRVANLSDSEYRQYRRDMDNLSNQESTLWSAEMKGEERGLKKGREEGEQSRAIQNAKHMLADNMPIDLVAKYSGLSVEEINIIQQGGN